MKPRQHDTLAVALRTVGLTVCFAVVASPLVVLGAEAPHAIDLATTLRLAGARSIDVEIARQDLRLAKAESRQVRERFFPWLSPGVSYRRHEGAIANVEGFVLDDVDKKVWEGGATIQAEVAIGDAIFAARSAGRAADAAEHGLDARQQDALLGAVLRYLDLLAAQARIEVFTQAEGISSTYENEVGRAVEAGLSSRSEQLRVRVETEKNRLAVERAEEERRVAAARLAEVLRVGGTLDIVADRGDIAPVALVPADTSLDALVAHALSVRGEVRRSGDLVAAAKELKNGAVYGPLVPSVGGAVGYGDLGGGPDGGPTTSGDSANYAAALRWRIGPGGLFDFPRIEAADARLRRSELEDERLRDAVTRDVVETHSRCASLSRRLETTLKALATTEQALALARQRRAFGIDVVLENIQAEQELTRARADYLLTVIDWNRAEYSLLRALGGTTPP